MEPHSRHAPLDAVAVERSTGWRVIALRSVASTNDEAARIRDANPADASDRVVVVAAEQTAGRGRGGHSFESPVGGLYASLLVRVSPADLPAPLVFASAVALAEAVEEAADVSTQIKWPNDVWIAGKKAAGILVETAASADRRPERATAIVGLGVNVAGVPASLSPDVAAETTAVASHARAPVALEALLVRILVRLDARRAALRDAAGRSALESEYRRRLALRGEPVKFLVGDVLFHGVLRDVSLERGVLVDVDDRADGARPAAGRSSWWAAEHVRELRPDPR